MYFGEAARLTPDRPAVIMASSGEVLTYAELEGRTNQLSHLLRAHGINPLDHYSIFMENNDRYVETCAAGERTGSHYTCINSHLTADELVYLVNNSESKVLITSAAKRSIVVEALDRCPDLVLTLVVGDPGGDDRLVDYESAISAHPTAPIADERLGTPMLYSSGTTGRPKGILRPLPDQQPSEPLPVFQFLGNLW